MRAACDLTSSPVDRLKSRRRGAMMLETQIALVVLGIGLAGLCPFVVMQLRQLTKLESRLVAYTYTYNSVGMASRTAQSNQSYYLVPWNNPWTRKLTARAQLLTTSSNPGDPGVTTPSVTHITLTGPFAPTYDANGNVTAVTVTVQVQ
ncbi:MAG: hypothetical protein ACLP7Q_21860 [Isosphaeraceae bacterium]